MKKLKKWLVIAGAGLLGVFFLVFGVKEFRQSKKLQAEGKQVAGVVTDGETQRGRKGRRSYYLTVSFKTEEGATMSERKKVSRSLFNEASEARTVPVTYLPSDASVCTFGPKVDTQFGLLIGGVVALGFAGFMAFGKGEDDDNASPASEAEVEQQLLADNSKYDDQQKAA